MTRGFQTGSTIHLQSVSQLCPHNDCSKVTAFRSPEGIGLATCCKPSTNGSQVQCRIFSTTYNPERLRTGNKILRQRLKGPSVVEYYPRRVVTFKDLKKAYPEYETWDEDEEDRLEGLEL